MLLVTVLGGLFVAWINPATGLGDEYTQAVQALAPGRSPEATIALLLTIFGVAHSGLASLRPKMEDIIGARVRGAVGGRGVGWLWGGAAGDTEREESRVIPQLAK